MKIRLSVFVSFLLIVPFTACDKSNYQNDNSYSHVPVSNLTSQVRTSDQELNPHIVDYIEKSLRWMQPLENVRTIGLDKRTMELMKSASPDALMGSLRHYFIQMEFDERELNAFIDLLGFESIADLQGFLASWEESLENLKLNFPEFAFLDYDDKVALIDSYINQLYILDFGFRDPCVTCRSIFEARVAQAKSGYLATVLEWGFGGALGGAGIGSTAAGIGAFAGGMLGGIGGLIGGSIVGGIEYNSAIELAQAQYAQCCEDHNCVCGSGGDYGAATELIPVQR